MARIPVAMISNPDRIEGFWPLRSDVPVHVSALGSSFPVRIGEQPAKLFVPQPPSGYDVALPEAAPGSLALTPPACSTKGFGDSFDWGQISEMDENRFRHASIKGLGISIDVPTLDAASVPTLSSVADLVSEVIDRVLLWIAVLTKSDVLSPEIELVRYIGGTLHYVQGNDWALGTSDWTSTGPSRPKTAITSAGFAIAVKKANLSEQPPDEWRLLLRAISAARQQDPRVAVIEAAAAVEQLLERHITQVVAAAESAEVQELLRQATRRWTLGTKVGELNKSKSLLIPDNTFGALVEVRNAVAHDGYEPTEAEVSDALGVAEEIIVAHSPLAPDGSKLADSFG